MGTNTKACLIFFCVKRGKLRNTIARKMTVSMMPRVSLQQKSIRIVNRHHPWLQRKKPNHAALVHRLHSFIAHKKAAYPRPHLTPNQCRKEAKVKPTTNL